LKPVERWVTAQAAAEWAGEGGWQRWLGEVMKTVSKVGDEEKFLE
jgi:hypothetical protein